MNETAQPAETPWRYRVNGVGRIVVEGGSRMTTICQVIDGAKGEANATLIVRAVNCHEDLLAACKGMLLGIRASDQEMWTHLKSYREAAEDAIAKAEGRTP